MRTRYLPILLSAMLIVTGCNNADVASPVDPPALTIEEQIIADAHVVRDALEAYAADNGDEFPGYPRPPFAPYLPGGTAMQNRYTGRHTLPVFQHPRWPGEIGVTIFHDEAYDATGYRVVGRGRYGELIRLENLSRIPQHIIDGYDLVLANVDTLFTALDVFFEQSGVYPSDSSDELPSGETLIDLLPGGRLLHNPFLGLDSEPHDGNSLGVAGAIGYLGSDSDADGLMDDFLMDACGYDHNVFVSQTRQSPEDEWVRSSFRTLKLAVQAYTEDNDGAYPGGLDVDDLSGNSLRDYIGNDDELNPYTNASAYRDGLATSRGEVGYVPLESGGVVVGYVINALGLFNEELERFEVLP